MNRRIDRFCREHPRFGVPNLMKIIVFGTALVYVLYILTGYNAEVLSFLTFDLNHLLRGEVWRLVTFVFMPSAGMGSQITGGFWLIISLFFFYFIGTSLEREWGTAKFNLYFFGGMVLSLIGTILASLISGNAFVLSGAYYINLSMFFAFAMLYPDVSVLLFFIIPVKVKYMAWVTAALYGLDIISAIGMRDFGSVLFAVTALLNFLLFFDGELIDWVRRVTGRTAHRASPKTIRYKTAVRRQRREKGYHHKCTVCGRTDADYPDLEFRYCSRCAGYHCYCADHITNHVHITDE